MSHHRGQSVNGEEEFRCASFRVDTKNEAFGAEKKTVEEGHKLLASKNNNTIKWAGNWYSLPDAARTSPTIL
jgi:hypothetical protein